MTRLTTKQREEFYDACKGDREFPLCALCSLPICAGQLWDVSHDKYLPRAIGGKVDGISHRKCNRLWNNHHDTPLVAKRKRIRQKHIGAYRSSARPLPGTITSGIKLRMNGTPPTRATGRKQTIGVHCGTAACAMGLAALSGAFKRQGLVSLIDTYEGMATADMDVGLGNLRGLNAGAELFEISRDEAEWLFLHESYSGRVTGRSGELKVATRIRDFIAEKAAPHL